MKITKKGKKASVTFNFLIKHIELILSLTYQYLSLFQFIQQLWFMR